MFEDVDEMVRDETYIETTKAIARAIKSPYDGDHFPAALKSIFLNYLRASGCSRQELLDCLYEDTENIVAFSVRKHELLDESADEQEYPEGEEVDEEDADVLVETCPIGPAFLIGYLCEFFLLKHKSERDLAAYVKRLRMTQQKKYLKDLKRIFDEVHD